MPAPYRPGAMNTASNYRNLLKSGSVSARIFSEYTKVCWPIGIPVSAATFLLKHDTISAGVMIIENGRLKLSLQMLERNSAVIGGV
jgi:hypothetical protein